MESVTYPDVPTFCSDVRRACATTVHDAAGNMTTVPQPDAPASAYTLTWDAWSRLVKVADGTTTIAEYAWDGSNRRIVKKIYAAGVLDETRHIYLSQSNQVLEERVDSSTSADRQFTWGARYIDDLVLRTRDTDASGTLDETVYALQDANWNITALTDTSGAVVERFQYTSYGQSTVLDANFTADADGISDYDWEYRFTSREYDSETALHYFRARLYHDGLGRFVGRDPITFVDGMSLYAAYFVPNYLDPHGLKGKKKSSNKSPVWTGQIPHFYQYTDQWGRPVYSPPMWIDTPEEFEKWGNKHSNPPPPGAGGTGGRPNPSTFGNFPSCGNLRMRCTLGEQYEVPVYPNSYIATAFLRGGSGCVTLLFGIFCTGNCDEIKKWRSGDNPTRSILDHEACHYCALKDHGTCPYIGTAGRAPDGCVGNERPSNPIW